MSGNGTSRRVRDANRVLRCYKCRVERTLSAAQYARKMDTRTPLTSPFDPCECGGFFALYRLSWPEDES